MLKMAFRQNLLYFASLIMFMDQLYLDHEYIKDDPLVFPKLKTLFLRFYCFYCCCCCLIRVAVVVICFVILLLLLYFFIILVLILCFYVRYYFFKVSRHSYCLCSWHVYAIYVIFNICNFNITFSNILKYLCKI